MSPGTVPVSGSGSDEPIIRNRGTINPNWTEPTPGMDDTDHVPKCWVAVSISLGLAVH
jgi:hypothetical protein